MVDSDSEEERNAPAPFSPLFVIQLNQPFNGPLFVIQLNQPFNGPQYHVVLGAAQIIKRSDSG
jgi:hypothetical protein